MKMKKITGLIVISVLLFTSMNLAVPKVSQAASSIPEKVIKAAASSDTNLSTTLVLSDQNHVWSWGNSGLTGTGSDYAQAIPHRVRFYDESGVEFTGPIKDIGVGSEHSVVLMETGEVWTFGKNFRGMLGDGTWTAQYKPVRVKEDFGSVLSNVYAIAVGNNHTLALKNDGTVWAWGAGTLGQLGGGVNSDSTLPVQVVLPNSIPLTGVKEIAAGEAFSMALTQDGKVFTWGYNYFGKLGLGNPDYNLPLAFATQISGPGINDHIVNHIFTNSSSSSAFYTTVSDSVYGWGGNTSGQLGNGDFVDYINGEAPVSAPTEIVALRNKQVVSIVSGQQHSLVLTANQQIWGMGRDSDGQLLHYSPAYDPAVYAVYTPVLLDHAALTGITSIAAGPYSSFVINGSGTLLAFGSNSDYQLGLPKQPIQDANADGKDDITWDSYTDANQDGYDDKYPWRATKPLIASDLIEQGFTVKGTLKNSVTGQPLSHVVVEFNHPVYGTIKALTDSLGVYVFNNVLPGVHQLHVSSSYSSYFSTTTTLNVDVASDFTNADLNVTAYWSPTYLEFTDGSPVQGVLSGTVNWDMPTMPLNGASYKIYFANELGSLVGTAGESASLAPFLELNNVPIPSGAKYLSLFVKSGESYMFDCMNECATGVKLPITDLADIVTEMPPAVNGMGGFDWDLDLNEFRGTIHLTPLPDETAISEYELFWTDASGLTVGPKIQEAAKGAPYDIVIEPNTNIPSGAANLTVYAINSLGATIGASSFAFHDSNRGDMETYRLQLKHSLNPEGKAWSIQDILQLILERSDVTDDGAFDTADVDLLLQMIDPVLITPISIPVDRPAGI